MVAPPALRRGDVFLFQPGKARGGEMRKMRPCVVLSPDELNRHLATCIVAPLTTGSHPYPFRIACQFQGKKGHVVLDQMRVVDRGRLVQRLGRLSASATTRALKGLQEFFAP